jgi:RNA polymerase sigma-70 factor (ECF subfamily)
VGRPATGGPALHRRQCACRALARCAGVPRYTRAITRNKFVDRLKRRLRCKEKEALPWDEETARALEARPDESESAELRAAVQSLPLDQQRVLDGIYTQGKTYQEVSDDTGIPLGTMKRRLRDAILALRRRFADA